MTIVSRPQPSAPSTNGLGTGSNTLNLTDEQLELVMALVYNCRLGTGTPYSQAAFELIGLIEDEFGDDFMQDASDNVNLQVTIEDEHGLVEYETDGSQFITLEV